MADQQNPLLGFIDKWNKPVAPTPKPKPKAQEPLVKGVDFQKSYQQVKAEEAKKKAQPRVRSIRTNYGTFETSPVIGEGPSGQLTPAQYKKLKDGIEADQAKGAKPDIKRPASNEPFDAPVSEGDAMNAGMKAGSEVALRDTFGKNSPLNSEPIRKLAKNYKEGADFIENSKANLGYPLNIMQAGGRLSNTLLEDKTIENTSPLVSGLISDTLKPGSSTLRDIERTTDKQADPLERAGSAVSLGMKALGAYQLPGQVAKGLTKLGVKGLEKSVVKSGLLEAPKPSFEVPKVQSDLLPPNVAKPTVEASPGAGLFNAPKLKGFPDAPAHSIDWHHGTTKQFSKLKPDALHNDLGIFLTSDKSLAHEYSKLTPFSNENPVGNIVTVRASPKKTYDIRFGNHNPEELNNVFDAMSSRADALIDNPKANAFKAQSALNKFNKAKEGLLKAKSVDEWKSAEAEMYDATHVLSEAEGKGRSNRPLNEELQKLGYDSIRKADDGADALVALDHKILSTPNQPVSPKVPGIEAQGQGGTNTTGISNRAQLDEAERGILEKTPEAHGRSADEIYESNRHRENYVQLADSVGKGASWNADDAAALVAGKQKLLKAQSDARAAVSDAIARGESPDVIDRLRTAYDTAKETTVTYVENVQKGKGDWSNLGRVLNKDVNIDTGDIEQVLIHSEVTKGSKLTGDEIKGLEDLVAEQAKQIASHKAEIDSLMTKQFTATRNTAIARRTPRTSTDIKIERKAAKDAFEKVMLGRSNALFGAVPDPEALKAFAVYLKTFADEGVNTLDDLLKSVAKDGVHGVERDDLIKALGTPTLRKKSDILSEMSMLRQEARDSMAKWRKEGYVDEKSVMQDAAYRKRLFENQKKSIAAREVKLKALQEQIDSGHYLEKAHQESRKVDAEMYRLNMKIKLAESKVRAGIEAKRPRGWAERSNNILSEFKLANPAARVLDLVGNTTRSIGYGLGSPLRSMIDSATSKVLKMPKLEHSNIFDWDRVARVYDRTKITLGKEAQEIVAGGSPDAIKKFGQQQGIFGKAAGLTDAPFKSWYYELGSDWMAESKAKQLLGLKAKPADIADMRDMILRSIDEHPDIQIGAHEFALRQTYNSDNWASMLGGSVKGSILGGNKVGALAYDEFIGRFSRVITNVATDAMDRTGVGVIRGVAKLLKDPKGLTFNKRLEINELIGKGLTGIALMKIGYELGDKMNGTIKGDRFKYLDFGDIEKMGGVMSPFLIGVTMRKAADSKDLDEDQKEKLRNTTIAKIPFNTPLVSNAKDVLDLINGNMGIGDYGAKKISNAVLPGGIRDTANRMDSKRYWLMLGDEVEREKKVKELNDRTGRMRNTQNFLKILRGEFQSKIPVWRQKLPLKQ